MPAALLGLLKYCLLALLYLFFLRVLWAVWSEVRQPRPMTVAGSPVPVAAPPKRRRRRDDGVPTRLIVSQPQHLAGRTYDLVNEVTLGRALGCAIALPDDTYASQVHARCYDVDGQAFLEDLGSTNGTWLNGQRITSPTPLRRGDLVQVGATVFEAV